MSVITANEGGLWGTLVKSSQVWLFASLHIIWKCGLQKCVLVRTEKKANT